MDANYDVFISYSSRDSEWVHGWLLPHLEGAGLRVCIDYRDFDIGVPSIVNMEQGVARSRKTVLVLSPNWMQSHWTDFEGLMVQASDPDGFRRNTLPLLLEKAQLPPRLAIFTYADFTNPATHEFQLTRMLKAISESGEPPKPAPEASRPPAPNPFDDVGRISNPARYLERQSEMQRIYNALKRNLCVSVIAGSKMGRSSLLYQVMAQGAAKLPTVRFAFVNLEILSDEKSFYESACKQLGGKGKRDRHLRALLESGGRTVFALDGMEQLNSEGYASSVRSFLRGMADSSDAPLKLLTGSRQPLAQLFPDDASKTSPFYNIFTERILLTNFSREVCEAFLDRNLRDTGVAFDPPTRDEIWTLTQGQPYKLQRAAHHVYESLRDPHYDWRAAYEHDV